MDQILCSDVKILSFFGCLLAVGISICGRLVFFFSKSPSFSVPQANLLFKGFGFLCLAPIQLGALNFFLFSLWLSYDQMIGRVLNCFRVKFSMFGLLN